MQKMRQRIPPALGLILTLVLVWVVAVVQLRKFAVLHRWRVIMAKVLAIACKKGGTTKTTVATQVAACLAEQGDRVLLVDLDSQHNATNALDE